MQDISNIKSVVAVFRNFCPKEPVGNAVIYFWESHNKDPEERQKTQAAINLIYKEFDMSTCEKYEVRTGYLSRYNFMTKPFNDCTEDEKKEAILKGHEMEDEWLVRCSPDFPGFMKKKWDDCISKSGNYYFEECKKLDN